MADCTNTVATRSELLVLAPMEGLLDFVLRDFLTRCSDIDRCVSEFIRVTNTLLPARVFQRIVPELHNGGYTFAGVSVRAQLLGSDPACLADNAGQPAALGPHGIDLNFGSPAKVVNQYGGGAALLDEPELLTRIMSAVRPAPCLPGCRSAPRCAWAYKTTSGQKNWWCMPIPRPTATAHLPIGNALPTSAPYCASR